MGELKIYDSQGRPIDSSTRREDERIKEFFFDGVRFALDLGFAQEVIVFFRARDNQSSRSEQYYAVYKFDSTNELKQLGNKVREVIEGEHGMILDTSQEDTEVFDYFVGDRIEERQNLSVPGRSKKINDLEKLLEQGRDLHLGVGSYRDACAVYNEIYDASIDQFAITDTKGSSQLGSYDIIVEVGEYHGLEPLGETENQLKKLRERRRRRMSAGTGESTNGGPLGRVFGVNTWAFDLAALVVVLLFLTGGGIFGACYTGTGPTDTLSKVPVLGSDCGSSTTGPQISALNVSYDDETGNITVAGDYSGGDDTYDDAQLQIFADVPSGDGPSVQTDTTTQTDSAVTDSEATDRNGQTDRLPESVFSREFAVDVTNGTFSEEVDGADSLESGEYRVELTFANVSGSDMFTVSDQVGSGETTETPPPESTPTATNTSTATQTTTIEPPLPPATTENPVATPITDPPPTESSPENPTTSTSTETASPTPSGEGNESQNDLHQADASAFSVSSISIFLLGTVLVLGVITEARNRRGPN